MNRKFCALLILAIISSQALARGKEKVYPIEASWESLKEDEISCAFNILGLTFQRFIYEVPDKRYGIEFTEEYFGNGKKIRTRGKGSLTRMAKDDKDTLLVFLHHHNHKLKIAFYTPLGGGLSFEAELDTVYGAFSEGPLKCEGLIPEERVPIFAFVANRGGIEGLRESETVESIKSKYDFAIVIFAKLLLK